MILTDIWLSQPIYRWRIKDGLLHLIYNERIQNCETWQKCRHTCARPISQSSQCIRRVHICDEKWCIVGYCNGALWDMYIRSIGPVLWHTCRLKSPAIWLFIQQFFKVTWNQSSKLHITGSLWGKPPPRDGFPSDSTVIRKAFHVMPSSCNIRTLKIMGLEEMATWCTWGSNLLECISMG